MRDRKRLLGVTVLTVGAVLAYLTDGAARVVGWEAAMVAAIYLVVREAWPDRRRQVPPLFGGGAKPWALPPRVLAPLELEIAAAVDPHLSGERPLRRRLVTLLRHRAGLTGEAVGPDRGRRLLGEGAWRRLVEDDGSLNLDEIEELTDRIEAL